MENTSSTNASLIELLQLCESIQAASTDYALAIEIESWEQELISYIRDCRAPYKNKRSQFKGDKLVLA